MKIKILYLFCIFCVLACDKEKFSKHCRDIPKRGDNSTITGGLDDAVPGYKIIRLGADQFTPVYHPTDPNQIIFKKYDHDAKVLTIEHYNLQTGVQKTVFTPPHSVVRHMDWSVKDWIVFAEGVQLWKIKSNGDSLTQLTFEYQNYYPVWSPDGKLLIHYESRKSDGTFLRVRDENMNIVKSYTEEKYFYGDWNKDNKIAMNMYDELSVLDYDIGEVEEIIDFDSENKVSNGVNWIPNSNSILWSTVEGLRVIDYITKDFYLLREDCPRRQYLSASVSPDGQNIIIGRMDWEVDKKDGFLYPHVDLFIMDIDGTNERVLNLN